MNRKPLKISWRAWCLYKLGKRDYSEFEMRQDLLRRAAESEQTVDVDAIVDKLVTEGMIDDTRYIESQIGLHAGTFGLKGPKELERKLRIKGGISPALISSYIDPEDRKWYDLARDYSQKALSREMNTADSEIEVSEKLFFNLKNRLYRKGFTRSQIDFALEGFKPKREVEVEVKPGSLQRMIENRMAAGKGPYDISQFLKQKGFDGTEIQAQMQFPDEVWIELAVKEREKRFGQGRPKTAKDKRKQIDFLRRRGYLFEHINSVFEQC
ncbi:MAG: hypothetical protein HOD85_10500 [Deltaproteobacteria bacterium]|nr:hypothetical protein [Deltaproteobacteria bacterium]